MGMVVRSNLNSMNANRNLSINNNMVAKAVEKLASGFAINRASDDASGLAITEKMQAQITGLDQGTDNALDGVGLVQTAEGAMHEIHNMLNRITELATKSANGTIQDEVDREAIQAEVDVLVEEIDRIAQSTNFNGIPLLDGSLSGGCITTSTDGNGSVQLNIDTSKTTTVGSFTVTGGTQGVDFDYVGGQLKILSDTHMRIEGGSNSESIVVDDVAGSANLALKNVNITSDTTSAFSTGNNDVYIELEGDNELSSTSSNYAGLNVGEKGSITIDGTGKLTAYSGDQSAAIGSNSNDNSGNITINGGVINAIGVGIGTGIGSGSGATIGGIVINGGNVTATSAFSTAIGSGDNGTVGNITINGGTIIATGGYFCAGIGTGFQGVCGDIIITGGNIVSEGANGGAGIGSGAGGICGDITYVEECVVATGGVHSSFGTPDDIGAGVSGTVGTITKIPLGSTDTDDNTDTDNDTDGESTTTCGNGLILHVADQNASYNKIQIYIDPMTGEALKIKPLYVDTQESAGESIDKIRNAINYVSDNRANMGALQNRIEYTVNVNNNTSENMSSAKSVIKDCDMASEMMEYTKMNVLTQSAQSMLAQSNQATQQILSLLGN